MKVKELIELLKQQDPDAVVVTWCNDSAEYHKLNEPEAIMIGDKKYSYAYENVKNGKTKAVEL